MGAFLDELKSMNAALGSSLIKVAGITSEEASELARKEGNAYRLKRALKWGAAGVGGTAALAGGGYLLHKYLKKKKAEQEAAQQEFPQGF